MIDELKRVVEAKDEQGLIKLLDFKISSRFDPNCYEYLEKILMGTWHIQHEDLLNTIYLENHIDDRFVDPILNIALNRELYRRHDDEMEATLRKCVHALMTIHTAKSMSALEKLKDLNNENVKIALEMYKLSCLDFYFNT